MTSLSILLLQLNREDLSYQQHRELLAVARDHWRDLLKLHEQVDPEVSPISQLFSPLWWRHYEKESERVEADLRDMLYWVNDRSPQVLHLAYPLYVRLLLRADAQLQLIMAEAFWAFQNREWDQKKLRLQENNHG